MHAIARVDFEHYNMAVDYRKGHLLQIAELKAHMSSGERDARTKLLAEQKRHTEVVQELTVSIRKTTHGWSLKANEKQIFFLLISVC